MQNNICLFERVYEQAPSNLSNGSFERQFKGCNIGERIIVPFLRHFDNLTFTYYGNLRQQESTRRVLESSRKTLESSRSAPEFVDCGCRSAHGCQSPWGGCQSSWTLAIAIAIAKALSPFLWCVCVCMNRSCVVVCECVCVCVWSRLRQPESMRGIPPRGFWQPRRLWHPRRSRRSQKKTKRCKQVQLYAPVTLFAQMDKKWIEKIGWLFLGLRVLKISWHLAKEDIASNWNNI